MFLQSVFLQLALEQRERELMQEACMEAGEILHSRARSLSAPTRAEAKAAVTAATTSTSLFLSQRSASQLGSECQHGKGKNRDLGGLR